MFLPKSEDNSHDSSFVSPQLQTSMSGSNDCQRVACELINNERVVRFNTVYILCLKNAKFGSNLTPVWDVFRTSFATKISSLEDIFVLCG